MLSPLRADLLSLHSEAALKEEHSSSEPYRHIVIQDLCDTERMLQVQREAKENLTANFKETDLFKVYQTGELGNFDDKDPVMQQRFPHLLSLRNAIYSDSFREFIARVMGVDDLTTRVDCSCNAYTQGCHLLCHDDVIGTRRISYIIYLTDQDWQTQDGGALELYPLEESSKVLHDHEDGSTSFQGIPTASPTRLVLPTFNSMMLFRVQPGKSYHSVQEVYSDDKPRLSISGWFHGPSPPPGADLASLNQIMTKGDDVRDFSPFVVTSSSTPSKPAAKPSGIAGKKAHALISSEDMDILSKWVNPIYLKASEIKKINEEFCSDSSIQLQDFIKPEIASALSMMLTRADEVDRIGGGRVPANYSVGEVDSEEITWSCVGPAHKRRHLCLKEKTTITGKKRAIDKSDDPRVKLGSVLRDIKSSLFASEAFSRYLELLTSLRPTGYRDEIRRFRPGLDYTVAHMGAMSKEPRLDATLCFVSKNMILAKNSVKENNEEDDDEKEKEEKEQEEQEEEEEEEEEGLNEDLWDSGDVGGYECYIAAEDEALEAAEVFEREDEDEDEDREDDEHQKASSIGSANDQLLSISAGYNVLSLVMRNENIMRFVKYVGSNAVSSRWDISMDYAIDIESLERQEADD